MTERLTHWGFNALGAWSTPQFWTDAPGALPFTVDVELSRLAPPDALLGPWASSMPDVFSTAWQAYASAQADAVCTPLRERRK